MQNIANGFTQEQIRFIVRILESRERGWMSGLNNGVKKKGRNIRNVQLCNFWLNIFRPMIIDRENKLSRKYHERNSESK